MSEIDLRDAILRGALLLQLLSASKSAEADAILAKLAADLKLLLNSRTLTEAGKAEINALFKQADEAINPAYEELAATVDTHELALVVADRTVAALEDVLPVAISTPTTQRLASLTKDVLIHGSPSSAWWSKQAEDTSFKFAAAVRQGVVNGETNEQIVARVAGGRANPGILDIARRNARALVHSSVMSAANDARLATFRKNARHIAGVRWLSTLDSHVCWTAETLILMADGTEKPIAEVRQGEMVIGGVSGEPKRVIAIMKNLAPSSVVIHCDGRYVGRSTEDHPILTPSGWREVGGVSLSADVSERKVLCRHHETAERPLSGTPFACGGWLDPRSVPSVAEARPPCHADHRQSDELRGRVRPGNCANREPEHEGTERLQHDGRRGLVNWSGSRRELAGQDHGEQPASWSRSIRTGAAATGDSAQLERPGLPHQSQHSARSQAIGIASRPGVEGEAGREVRRGHASQMARPGVSGEDGGAQGSHHSDRRSEASDCEAAGNNEGAPFLLGQEVLGHTESVTVGILTGERVVAPVEVYNLTVEEDHTYVAGGVIAHNCVQCAALDGQAWDLDGGKLSGTGIDFITPPAHWSCRCVLSPIPKSLAEFGIAVPEGQRASSQGPVPSSTTFADFLKRQSPEFVDRVLGKRRAELYLSGKLTLTDLVSGTGRELTLEQI